MNPGKTFWITGAFPFTAAGQRAVPMAGDDRILTSAMAYAALKHRIIGRFTRDCPQQARQVARRLPLLGKKLRRVAGEPCLVIRGMVLYAHLLQDLLEELGSDNPNWKRAAQLQLWIEMLEYAAGSNEALTAAGENPEARREE
jgi:hypothetical protein